MIIIAQISPDGVTVWSKMTNSSVDRHAYYTLFLMLPKNRAIIFGIFLDIRRKFGVDHRLCQSPIPNLNWIANDDDDDDDDVIGLFNDATHIEDYEQHRLMSSI